MSVSIRVQRRVAILRQGRWFAAHPGYEDQLNRITEDWIRRTGGPPLDDDDPEYTVAKTIATELGGHISSHVKSPDSRSLYLQKRQMEIPY